jgi:hypothetical protein
MYIKAVFLCTPLRFLVADITAATSFQYCLFKRIQHLFSLIVAKTLPMQTCLFPEASHEEA